MNVILRVGRGMGKCRSICTAKFNRLPKAKQSFIIWGMALLAVLLVSLANPDPAYAQANLESFASKVRGLLSSTLLRTLAVIAVIVTGLLWFTGRASTAVLVTVIIGIAIVFSADSIVGIIAG
jgi:type IV secretory pathway VirB2 component (pilin)